MFTYIMIGSNDLDRTRKFYDALFSALGADPAITDSRGRLIYRHNGGMLMVTRPVDGNPATHANGGTLGLTMNSPAEADACYKAGIENGGISLDSPPRHGFGALGELYTGFIRDPDGNKICLFHWIKAINF